LILVFSNPLFAASGSIAYGPEIHEILRTRDVVAGEDLQRDQMPGSGNPDRDAAQQFDRLSVGYDLALDSGRREEQIDNRRVGWTGARQSDCREPPDSVLLDNRVDAVIAGSQTADETFSLGIIRHRHGEIGIARESRLGTRRDGEAPNKCERRLASRRSV
jgi:hypothetical protein